MAWRVRLTDNEDPTGLATCGKMWSNLLDECIDVWAVRRDSIVEGVITPSSECACRMQGQER
jgi:hypothetical protein